MNIVLVGMRGSGKSAAGRRSAQRLGVDFVDTDELVARRAGMSVGAIFRRVGETRFRDLESEAIRSLPAAPPAVFAAGGGAPLREGNRKALSRLGKVVWLRASAGAILARIAGSGRPSLTALGLGEEVELVLREREPVYGRIADFTVETDGKTIEEVADELEQVWRGLQDDDVR